MFTWKYRIHAVLILSVLAIIFVPQIMNKPSKEKVETASIATQEFFFLVDAGRYADSWQICDAYLQEQVPLKDWEEKLTRMRGTVGPLADRELGEASFTVPAIELPDQEVMLLEYDSRFQLKSTTETVTVVQGKDNNWRVVGYFIQ